MKPKETDPYAAGRKLERALERLEDNPDMEEEAKEAIRRFVQDPEVRGHNGQGLSVHRRLFYLQHLPPVAAKLGENFLDPSKEKVKQIVAEIEASDYASWTQVNKRVAIKRFYKWLLGADEEYPDSVRWISTTPPAKTRLPDEIPTEEDIQALLDACLNPRDRALIALLADGGLRIGEVLSLRIQDYTTDRLGGVIVLPADATTLKTGQRRIRLISSVQAIAAWLRVHPRRDERASPFFCYLSDQAGAHAMGEAISYPVAYRALQRAAQRAGVPEEKVNPHAFRHYAATQLAEKVPEVPLQAQLGWVPGSRMTRVYTHLSGAQQDRAIARARGVDVEEEAPATPALLRCRRCDAQNEGRAEFCGRCGAALTKEGAIEEERAERRRIATFLADIAAVAGEEGAEGILALLRNPRVLEELKEGGEFRFVREEQEGEEADARFRVRKRE